jgi:hypothetical protein
MVQGKCSGSLKRDAPVNDTSEFLRSLAPETKTIVVGILTLSDGYTRYEGHCLQFVRSDIERVIQLDSWKSNYQWVGLHELSYGVNKNSQQYRNLCFQMEQSILSSGYAHEK